jgi:hypothetical protein
MKECFKFDRAILILFVICLALFCKNNTAHYKGKPFSDSIYKSGPQIIPGEIQCEYYDLGGAEVAYHDTDSANSGSGKLNPADGTYLNEFRKNENVDISYTKVDEREIDNNPYNWVEPEKNQLYVGWTEPGEWLKYTVRVQKSGAYTVGLMYTSNRGGKILLSIDDRDATGPIEIPSTFAKDEPIAWRQWHHWNYLDNMVQMELKKGVHVLTLITVAGGNMNYDFLEFNFKDNQGESSYAQQ